MIYVFLAEGFEEMEALAPVDILRRAELPVTTVGVTGKEVTGSHGITVRTDMEIGSITTDDMDMVILPGGMPGTLNLEKDPVLKAAVSFCAGNDKYICAICAAPSILGHWGLLEGKKAVCFPGFEGELTGAQVTEERVQVDGKYITAKGAGVSVEFALKIVECFDSPEKAQKLFAAMQCK